MALQPDELAKRLVRREAELRGKRSAEENLWQLLARYCIPRKANFTEKTAYNTVRDRQILDSTAPRSLELFASFLHSSLNNPTQMWFDLQLEAWEASKPKYIPTAVTEYLPAVKKRMMSAMTTGSASVYTALHEAYIDLGVFGTAVLYVEADPNDLGGLRIYNYHLDSVVVDEGDSGKIDFAIRKWCWNARQAKQRWPGRELGRSLDADYGARDWNSGQKEITFLHACFPATDEDLVKLLPADKLPHRTWPYLSVWVNATDNVTLEVSGYERFPFCVPRWYKAGQKSVYGRSPAMTVLGDILMVNRMAETVLRGAEKLVDPPLVVPEGGIVSPVRLHPGGLTYSSEPGMRLEPLIPPGASRIELGEALIKERQQAIREGFFVPLFISPESPVQTATAVLQQADERNRATSPMIVRLQAELFDGLLGRVFDILYRNGQFPEPPEELVSPIRPKYLSPIAASVKQVEALAVQRVFEGLAPWAQIDDGVFDAIDIAKLPAILVSGAGAPAEILRTETQVRQVQAAKEQQAQAQQMQQGVLQAVDAGAKLQTSQAALTKAQR